MRRTKKVLAVILAAAMTLSLAACGNKDKAEDAGTTQEATPTAAESATGSNEATPTEADASTETGIEPCEVTFWHGMTGQQEATLTELTDQFNEENTYGIKVTLVNQGAYNDLSTKLTANAVADTLPDMAQVYNSWVTPYLEKAVVLDDLVAKDFDNYEDLVAGYRAECEEFGNIYSLPFNKSTYVYFYNKTLFDELGLSAPKTWDDLTQIAEVIKAQKDIPAIGFDDLTGMLESYVAQNGSGYIEDGAVQFNNETGLETMNYIMNLFNNGYARLVGEDGYFSNVLSSQLIGGYVGSSTGVTYIDASNFELGVAPLPSNVASAANQAGTNLMMFSKDENQQLATWEYMKFLTSKDATTKWAMETGYLPVRLSAYESDEYQSFMANDITSTAAYSQVDYFVFEKSFEGSYDIRNAVSAKLEELILEKVDGQTALDAIVSEIETYLK